jgi:hypothetical protein
MPIIVAIEDNKVDLATATDTKFRAPDYSGSGLEALGAGLVQLGDGGRQLAGGIEERRRRAAEAIAAAKLGDRHQRSIDDAAVKKAYIDYSDLTHEALNGDKGLFKQRGADAHAAFPDLVGKLVDNHDKVLASLDDVQRAALAPTFGARLRSDVDLAANHVREQGKAAQEWQAEKLLKATLRDAVASFADPDMHDHHMATGENNIIKQGQIKSLPDKEINRQIADYKSAVHAATVAALIPHDPVNAAGWYARNSDKINDVDKEHVDAKLGPALVNALTDDGVSPPGAAEDVAAENGSPDLLDPALLASLHASADAEARVEGATGAASGDPVPTGIEDIYVTPRALLNPQLVASLEAEAQRGARDTSRAVTPSGRSRRRSATPPAVAPAMPRGGAPFTQALQQLARTLSSGAPPQNHRPVGAFDRLDQQVMTTVDDRLARMRKSLSFDYGWITHPRQGFDTARSVWTQLWRQGKTPWPPIMCWLIRLNSPAMC